MYNGKEYKPDSKELHEKFGLVRLGFMAYQSL